MLQRHVGAVDVERPLGNHERGGLARAVELVTQGDGVGKALAGAARGADFLAGVDVELQRRVWENDGPNVAAFHDEMAVRHQGTLLIDQAGAHGGHLGHVGHSAINRLAVEFLIGEGAAIDQHLHMTVGHEELQLHGLL